MLGVVMPSVDLVGREYPLTLMAPVRNPPSLWDLHFGAAATFLALEDVALASLEDDMTRAILTERLSEISPPRYSQTIDAPSWAVEQIEAKRHPSIWTAELEQGARILVSEGLPNAAQMADLFDLNAAVWRSHQQMPEIHT